jgi:hypothetical protein
MRRRNARLRRWLQLILHRVFAGPFPDLGPYTALVLKQHFDDASFTEPHNVRLCDGLIVSSFSYSGDLEHDGRRTLTQEVIAQGTPVYALIYRRPIDVPGRWSSDTRAPLVRLSDR